MLDQFLQMHTWTVLLDLDIENEWEDVRHFARTSILQIPGIWRDTADHSTRLADRRCFFLILCTTATRQRWSFESKWPEYGRDSRTSGYTWSLFLWKRNHADWRVQKGQYFLDWIFVETKSKAKREVYFWIRRVVTIKHWVLISLRENKGSVEEAKNTSMSCTERYSYEMAVDLPLLEIDIFVGNFEIFLINARKTEVLLMPEWYR